MTRQARIRVGDPRVQDTVLFPPGDGFGPRRIAAVAQAVLEDDFLVNVERIYPLLGFDAAAAMRLSRARQKERALREAGRLPPLSELHRSLQPRIRAIGLELVTGLFLDCLDSPTETTCACAVYMDGDRPIPVAPAGKGKPDARANYPDFTIVAEATIGKKTGPEPLQRQYTSAIAHIGDILTGRVRPRGYCLMVSRAKLRDEQVPVLIVETQEELDRNHGPGNVRVLAFGIDEMAHIAEQLDRLYPDGKDVRPPTAEDLADILDTLHGETMEWISSGEPFPDQWAAKQFEKLLRKHASGRPVKTLFDQPPEQDGQAADD